MLTCKEITELVTDYLEGRLSFMERLKFLWHLSMCGPCRAYVKQVKMTVEVLGKMETPPPSPDMERELLRQFSAWSSTK